MEKQRMIRVTGTGTLKLRPDLTRLTLTLQGTDADYAAVLKRSADDTETLRRTLAGLGFSPDGLKTLQFNVDTVYEGYQDEQGVYRNRFVGYQFRHELKLEFPMDNALLGRTLYALANGEIAPEFRISYTVSDRESAKNALLTRAVQDAKEKAETLAAAAELTLGGILNIDYALGEPDLEVRPMRKLAMAANCDARCEESYDMNIEPDDIRVTDTVTVVWEIR